MASGKSTVSRWFREWGAAVVDGDVLGWEMLREPEIVAALKEAFGAGIMTGASGGAGDGSVDRAALGRIVFRGRAEMERLNEIVQPRLLVRVREALDAAASSGSIVLLDAALLTTWRLEPELDGVVEVQADEGARERRLLAGRGLDASTARERIRGQRLPPVKNAKRHWIIRNDGDLEALRLRAEAVWKEIAALP